MAEQDATSPTDIAIIGMSGRFPGARNVAEFWRNLRDGVESISFFSDEELTAAGVEAAVLRNPEYVRAGGVLEDVELFDAAFFGFNPKEADTLDPQQRLFLESAWEALEDAGYDPESYEGLIGVYAGSAGSSYLANLYSHPELIGTLGDFQIGLGNDKDNLPTSVSYKLNLKGPSMAIQTACSTSLVAIAVACQNLLSYQCDMALAGGVRVSVPQASGYFYQEGGIMSPDGHCRAFDSQARGTVGGNGVGLVLMKRLEEALADGDHVYAVIKGAAINNDGAVKVGYTAPSIEGQAQVIGLAQAIAGVDAETITYIETHGTGTDLGDPIEVAALSEAFRAGTERNNFCAIGSVKTNIGHLDTAAGVAGLIKTVLALQHRMIPPSLNFEQPNPKIDFAESPFYVNSRLKQWQTNGTPLRAGVSSFGIGGTNAHVVLEEAPPIAAHEDEETEQLLVVSARSRNALDAATRNLSEHLKQNPDLHLADVAYTLQVGRRAFSHRRAIVCRSIEDAVGAFEETDRKRVLTSEKTVAGRPVVFMFPGQGAQHTRMARETYRAETVFREQVDRCSELLRPHLGLDLREVIFAEEDADAGLRLQQTSLAQPALFVIEYALAQLWQHWGIRPQAMIGHSLGEYSAASLAGVFSLEDALSLVAARGRLMQEMPAGAMLAVQLPAQALESRLGAELEIAAVNVPSTCVVSGPFEAIALLEAQLSAEGHAAHRLQTSHAFHSQMMDAMLEEFAAEVRRVKLNPPQMRYVSNRTGDWITAAEATNPNYWVEHLRRTVRFGEGVERFFPNQDWLLLEVGPGQTLSGLARQHKGKPAEQLTLSSLPHRNDEQPDYRYLLTQLGRLWLAGVQVNWRGLHVDKERRRVSLPTYPFERQRFWVEYQAEAGNTAASSQPTRGKKPDIADWFYLPSWRRSAPAALLQEKDLGNAKLCWLIFADSCGVSSSVANRLAQAGQQVVTVKAGEQFLKSGDDEYAIAPGRSDDYRALFEELRALNALPDRILHFWSVTPDEHAPSTSDSFKRSQETGFYSLLFLAQALGAQEKLASGLRLEVISNRTQNVTGDEATWAAKTTIFAPCIVIPQEYPHITCRHIDVVTPKLENGTGQRLIAQLLSEFTTANADKFVAYRGGHRWVQAFEEVRLEKEKGTKSRLRQNGVYLITGGLGGVGLVLAKHLARTRQAKLVLTGRTALPERQDWEQWLSVHTDEDDEVSRKIRGLQELEALGAEVLTLSADVSDLAQMKGVVRRTLERFGALNGVIHAAGLTADSAFQPLQEATPAECERHFQPKAHGLMVLDEALSDTSLDFCVLLSSISSILGGLGFAAYAAANIFMDAYATAREPRTHARWTSVNWDGWQLWEEEDQTNSELAELALLPDEGAEAFERILSREPVSQIVVSTGDLQGRINRWVKLESLKEAEDSRAVDEAATAAHARPDLGNTFVEPRNEAERVVADAWQRLLGIERVGVHDNFFELGGHSLLALQVVARLRDVFQVEVPVRDLFDAPTVAELAERIEPTRHKAAQEVKQIDEMLQLVEQMSEAEIEALLAKQELAEED
jgi:acyl transferase domain-containing protein